MLELLKQHSLQRGARGISSTTAIIIAAVVVVLFSGVVMWMLRAALGLLWIAVEIAVLILVVLVVAYFIRVMSKKVSE